MTPEQERQIRLDISDHESWIRRGDSVEALMGDVRLYEEHIRVLLAEIDPLRLKLAEVEKERDEARSLLQQVVYKDSAVDIWVGDFGHGVMSQGETQQEALDAVRSALQLAVDSISDRFRISEARVQRLTEACVQAKSAIIWLQRHSEPTGGQPERALCLIDEVIAAEGGGCE